MAQPQVNKDLSSDRQSKDSGVISQGQRRDLLLGETNTKAHFLATGQHCPGPECGILVLKFIAVAGSELVTPLST